MQSADDLLPVADCLDLVDKHIERFGRIGHLECCQEFRLKPFGVGVQGDAETVHLAVEDVASVAQLGGNLIDEQFKKCRLAAPAYAGDDLDVLGVAILGELAFVAVAMSDGLKSHEASKKM